MSTLLVGRRSPSRFTTTLLRSATLACLFGIAQPATAIAQPDVWTTFPRFRVSVESLASTNRQDWLVDKICIGEMSVTPDRRSLFIAADYLGLARFDTQTRQLVEVLPDVTGCSNRVVADPTDRWWFVFTPTGIGTGMRLRILDAVSRQVIADNPDSTLRDVAFDDRGGQYELHQLPGSWVIRRVAATPNGETVWETPTMANALRGNLVASWRSVFAAMVSTSGEWRLLTYNSAFGGFGGEIEVTDTPQSSDKFRVASMAVAGDHVYLSGWYGAANNRLGLVVLDALTTQLTALKTETFPTGWAASSFAATIRGQRAYRTRVRTASSGPSLPNFFSVAVDTIDLTSLATVATWAGFANQHDYPESIVGQIAVPGVPRVEGLAVAGGRVQVSWEPDASGAAPRQFVIRGARRGQLPTTTLATLDATVRVWQSPAVPSGEYTLEIVAVNAAGESEPARVELAVDATGTPGRPTFLLVSSTGHSVAELTWNAPETGPLPSGYQIEAAVPGGPFFPVAQTVLPRLKVSGIPTGAWRVRVRALTATALGEPTFDSPVNSDPCRERIDPPRTVSALTNGSHVLLQWRHSELGPPATYRIDVASDAQGINRIASLVVDGSRTSFDVQAPSGNFLVTVRAENACASGPVSNPVVVRVP